ncbi:NUDIX hydrolase [Alkalicoccobacillus murimartini]|uniref:8-oxo-dGTP pyrophosphatase MutT (NUDIX family) n=1 Tax=Alkalicoccobacillus murimartini TaxID=171685 RepID=A0ABT9YMX7_9BACI|nr:NUDIX domain-containing protein [Alkalicoccobacillus murimartini]MDQ0209198.1 8-oxo-dGTP pyrophosphatase MutT (NUDIX family) [Alkalicoccobacillus murimartini]
MEPHLFGSVHLLFQRENEILLLQRQNTGFEDGNWSVVAGKIDPNEDMLTAVQREAKEEVGVVIDRQDIEVAGVLHRLSGELNWVDFFVRITEWKGTPYNAEPDKSSALAWFPIEEMPDNTIQYVRQAIEKKEQKMWYDSDGWT